MVKEKAKTKMKTMENREESFSCLSHHGSSGLQSYSTGNNRPRFATQNTKTSRQYNSQKRQVYHTGVPTATMMKQFKQILKIEYTT